MADFNLAYAPVAKWEGGWTHDSGDKGGETFRGCARNFFGRLGVFFFRRRFFHGLGD